jgi:hypothetical protein
MWIPHKTPFDHWAFYLKNRLRASDGWHRFDQASGTAGDEQSATSSCELLHASEAAIEPLRRRVLQVDYAVGQLPGRLEWLGV